MNTEFKPGDILITPFGGEYPVISSEIEDGIEWVLVDRGEDIKEKTARFRTFNAAECVKG